MLTVVFIIELIVEISFAVLAFTAQDYITNHLKGFMNPYVEGYEPSSDRTQLIDNIQMTVRKSLNNCIKLFLLGLKEESATCQSVANNSRQFSRMI